MNDRSNTHNPSGRPPATGGRPAAPDLPPIDVAERGAEVDGKPQTLDRRLFMQLLVFTAAPGSDAEHVLSELGERFEAEVIDGVLYADANDPRGLAVLTWSEDPAHFVLRVRPVLAARDDLELRPELTMLGRSYSIGYEQNLAYWILDRPSEMAVKEGCDWAVWYPLRRNGAFAKLSPRERGPILAEHAMIGRAYGEKGLAHDIRLACHGLDANDNEFVIGLVAKDLHPLSHLVQTMRSTQQTSTYISQMGPFFVGYVRWRRRTPKGT